MLSIHSILNNSRVNGPGERMCIWTQGCIHGCKGCFNKETWEISDKFSHLSPLDLAHHVLRHNPEGLTISGGDPLLQAEELYKFLELLHNPFSELRVLPKGIICFTGYTIEEIENMSWAKKCLKWIDLLIDGKFVMELKHENSLSGSSNQRFHFNPLAGRGKDRIKPDEIEIDQEIEIHSNIDHLEITGFPTLNTNKLKESGLEIIHPYRIKK